MVRLAGSPALSKCFHCSGLRVKLQRGLVLIIAGPPHIIDAMIPGAESRIDARVSIAVCGAIGAAELFFVSSPQAMTGLLAYVLLLLVVLGRGSRNPARALGRHVTRLAPAVALIVILNGLLVPGEAIVSIGGRTVLSQEGTSAGMFFSLRLLVLYTAMALFLLVTPPVEFARGIHTIVRPVSRKAADGAAFYGFLILSFIPLFSDELERIRRAQSFRGADLKSGGIARRAVAVRALIVPLVLSAIHRSGQLAAVVEVRGLRHRVGTALPSGKAGFADLVLVFTTALMLAVFTIWSGGGGR